MHVSTQIDADWRHRLIGDAQADGFAPPLVPLADFVPGEFLAILPGFLLPATSASAAFAPMRLPLSVRLQAAAEPAMPAPATPPVTTPPVTTPPVTAPLVSGVVGAGADQVLQSATARAETGLTGAGIKIGILSDSFDVNGGYAADVADGALPAGITVLQEGPAGSTDEGQAMAELINQVAPGAQIYFTTAFDGESGFAAGIAALVAAGCTVIVDDVTYLDEPFFSSSGVVAAAVAQAVAQGVDYFTAASNEGSNFLQEGFDGIAASLPGVSGSYVAQNFGSSARPNTLESLTIAPGSTTTIDLQWEQIAGIADSTASSSLGMVLYNSAGQIVAYAMANQTGAEPDQILQFTNTTQSSDFHLAIVTDGGVAAPGLFKFIVYGQGTVIEDRNAGIGSGTLIGHEMTPGANAVGAIDYTSTAAYGGNDTVEGFSSIGPNVAFVAPDGVSTSVFAPFYGTSAAAPNAAAVAALVLQADPSLSPAEVTAVLADTASPVRGAVGATGAGLIDAAAAVQLAQATALSGNTAALLADMPQSATTAAIAATLGTQTGLAGAFAAGGFSASLSDPTGALGLAQVAAASAGSLLSLAMVAGADPVALPPLTNTIFGV